MADKGFKRKLATILSADTEGYSRLMSGGEESNVQTSAAYLTSLSFKLFNP